MTDALYHRGPDGEGAYTDGPLGLGHRRLAIIDRSDANQQPMASADGRYVMSYNGEVYNFRELRAELESRGHRFRTTGDTEVVLNAIAEYGVDAVSRFNGMFALAIWDSRERRLTLARDRSGIKPVYFATFANTFIFASEIKSIACHPAYRTDIDLDGLVEYFTFQNFFTDRTLFKSVKLLPQAGLLSINADGHTEFKRYWDFAFSDPQSPKSDNELLDELDGIFTNAVERQLVSDVEVGAYLSGGMDSGSITAIASARLPYIKSFTCGFDLTSASGIELGFDERQAAERMSYRYQTEHYEMVLKSGDMERVMTDLVRHLEEPRVGQCYPNYFAAKLAGRFVKVVLSGAGGDELFGGYPWRYYRAVVNDDFDHYIDQYYDFWQRLVRDRDKPDMFRPIWNEVKHVSTREIFRDVFTSHADQLTRPEDYVNHSMYFEARTFLHGLLVVEDKLSMAHSLETRVPFLDNEIVDFAMRLPVNQRLGNLAEVIKMNENEFANKRARYFQKTNDGKLLFRKMMRRHIPEEVANREKQGFSAPDATWFKGESIDYVRDLLYSKNARIYDYLDFDTVRRMVDLHLQGQVNQRLLIWSLIYFENFLAIFNAPQAAPAN